MTTKLRELAATENILFYSFSSFKRILNDFCSFVSLSPHCKALTFYIFKVDFPTCLVFWISFNAIDQAKSEYKMLVMSIRIQSGWSLIRYRDQRLGENFNVSSFLPNLACRWGQIMSLITRWRNGITQPHGERVKNGYLTVRLSGVLGYLLRAKISEPFHH